MTLSELIKSHAWLSVALTLQKLFPDHDEYMADYEKMFNELQVTPPKVSAVTINIELIHDTYDDTHYVDVSGYYTNPEERTDEFSNSLAIEFTPWNEWLGMPIDENSLKKFSQLEIIAHCLDEMSCSGFDQEKIQEELNRIKGLKEDYDNLTPDEKAQRTYTLDEVKDMFNIKDKEEDEPQIKDEGTNK
ncbi:MAG: hypothetical protein PF517_11430 [Salinivirgaceae bacterium]|jgi:hypothetical protein|nr:hypothetical protein [Salinivirgaceae bacterium]